MWGKEKEYTCIRDALDELRREIRREIADERAARWYFQTHTLKRGLDEMSNRILTLEAKINNK